VDGKCQQLIVLPAAYYDLAAIRILHRVIDRLFTDKVDIPSIFYRQLHVLDRRLYFPVHADILACVLPSAYSFSRASISSTPVIFRIDCPHHIIQVIHHLYGSVGDPV